MGWFKMQISELTEKVQEIKQQFDIDNMTFDPPSVNKFYTNNIYRRVLSVGLGLFKGKPVPSLSDHIGNLNSGIIGAGCDLVSSGVGDLTTTETDVITGLSGDYVLLSFAGSSGPYLINVWPSFNASFVTGLTLVFSLSFERDYLLTWNKRFDGLSIQNYGLGTLNFYTYNIFRRS